MTAPYVALAAVTLWVVAGALVALGWTAVKGVLTAATDDEDLDAKTWRTLRACDSVDEALGEWARLELNGGDIHVAHNIAVARGMVGNLRDMTAADYRQVEEG